MDKREENVRYVNVGNPTGWAAMAKTISGVDEDKVNDYKEDIDTLLVFTGLFSAVLSAFVVESYKNLSPDKTDTIIALLSQISNQPHSCTSNVDVINSSVSTMLPATQAGSNFEPTLAALRVNTLWFASLITTLMTASFGMLVKQWLREYLAFNYTSPHERVRARQFRHPGLASWKVFEIAGLLPLLLQLALALFFLGLCFFTRSVNASVGNATTPLVAGWAFFFASATIAPLCSPRCPYKTALLKGIMRKFRRRIRRVLFPFSFYTGLQAALLSVAPGLLPSHAARLNRTSLRDPTRIGFIDSHHFVEEEEAVKKDTDEVAILEEVDAILLDDELLGTTIFDSLTQNSADPSTVIKFVLQALNARLIVNLPVHPLVSILDLQRLTKRGWIAVSDIVASTIQQALGKRVVEHVVGPWFEDAIYLLFSLSDQQLTRNAGNALVRCVHKDAVHRFGEVIKSLSMSPRGLKWLHVRARLCRICELLSVPDVTPWDAVNFVIRLHAFEKPDLITSSEPLTTILDLRSSSHEVWNVSCNTIGTIVVQALANQGASANSAGPWLGDALYIILSLSEHPITDRAWDALVRCVQKDAVSHLGEVLRSLTCHKEQHVPHVTGRVITMCKLLTTRDVPAHETVNFALHAFGDGRPVGGSHSREATSLSLLDLRELSEELWTTVSDTVATAVLNTFSKRASPSNDIGHWFEDALFFLLSLSDRPMTDTTRKVLVRCIQKDAALRSRLGRLIRSLESPESERFPHVMSRLCECLSASVQDTAPADIINFVHQSLNHHLKGNLPNDQPASASVFDLRLLSQEVWVNISDVVAVAVVRAFNDQVTAQEAAGPWLEEALRILLSLSEHPVTPHACEALNHCLQKDVTSRSRTLHLVRSLASSESTQLSFFISRLSGVCEHLFNYSTAPPDVMYLLLGALNQNAEDVDSDHSASTTLLDLRQLSQPAWTSLSDAVAGAVVCTLQLQDKTRTNTWTGPWLGDATRLLLSLSDHAMTDKAWDALVCCTQDDTAAHFIQAFASPEHEHFPHVMRRLHGLCDSLLSRSATPPDIIGNLLLLPVRNCLPAAPSAPLSSLIDLRTLARNVWDPVLDSVAKTVLKGLEKHTQDIGTWLEDAMYILLSLSEHPLPPTACAALAGCVADVHKRFSKCVRPLAAPDSPHYAHVIARVRAVCPLLASESDVEWLVRKIASSAACTPGCAHGDGAKPSQLHDIVHDHAAQYQEWARHYLPLLLDRVRLILEVPPGARWPTSSVACLDALLSFRGPLDTIHPESSQLLLKILCNPEHTVHALTSIVSVDPKERSHVVMESAVEVIASVIYNADSEGRSKFFESMRASCTDYLQHMHQDKSVILGKLNVVRLCALASKVHAEVRSDADLVDAWRAFYAECAAALQRFHDVAGKLKPKERGKTGELAETCLTALDRLELPAGDLAGAYDKWAEAFDAAASVFPDVLFERLALFVADDVALRYKRVRRLREGHRHGVHSAGFE